VIYSTPDEPRARSGASLVAPFASHAPAYSAGTRVGKGSDESSGVGRGL